MLSRLIKFGWLIYFNDAIECNEKMIYSTVEIKMKGAKMFY